MIRKSFYIITLMGVIFFTTGINRAHAIFDFWDISEIYSNADGTIQFIELLTLFNSQQFTMGQTIRASQGASINDFIFPSNTPSPTANKHLLLATAGFASEPGAVTPDFILPDGFLFTNNGTVDFLNAIGNRTYTLLPTGGILSFHYPSGTTGTNSPTNFAGQEGSIAPSPTGLDSWAEYK